MKNKFITLFMAICICAVGFSAIGCGESSLKHTLVKVDAVLPGCVTMGNSEYYACSKKGCEATFSDKEGKHPILRSSTILSPLGHSFGVWYKIKDATITSELLEERICHCQHKEHRLIADTQLASSFKTALDISEEGVTLTAPVGTYYYKHNFSEDCDNVEVKIIGDNNAVVKAYEEDTLTNIPNKFSNNLFNVKKGVNYFVITTSLDMIEINISITKNNSLKKVNSLNIGEEINKDSLPKYIVLQEGNYNISINHKNKLENGNTGKNQTSPFIFNREIGELKFIGEDVSKSIINTFNFDQGAVKYKNENGSNSFDYYYNASYKIKTLYFENVTFNGKFKISSLTDNYKVEVESLVFNNVIFNGSVENAIFHIQSANNSIKNISFISCRFENLSNKNQNAILLDVRNDDNVNLSIENCIFKNVNYNAIQLGGLGSNYKGQIYINKNIIENTGDRAIRFSNLDKLAKVLIINNTFINSKDSDGEVIKASLIDEETQIIFSNNTFDGETLYNDGIKVVGLK